VLLTISGPNDYVAILLACAVFWVIGTLTILPVRR
jgi:hypothetical protein